MSPFYPPELSENHAKDHPHFDGPDEVAQHQAENFRQTIGDELWEWLEKSLASAIAARVADMLMLPHKRWLSISEAMAYAGVSSRETIRKWINKGYIYGFKRSGSWIVDRKSIDDWYESEKMRL